MTADQDFTLARRVFEAMVRGDADQVELLSKQLDRKADIDTNFMISAGFLIAAEDRWDEATDTATVRTWVANLRSQMENTLGEIDPVACENIIISAVTGDTDRIAGIAPGTANKLESLMVFKLIHDRNMSVDAAREYVDEVEKLAKQWEQSA